MSKLAYYVHVEDEFGDEHVFGPEDDVPAWAAKQITNRSAWEGEELPAAAKKTAAAQDDAKGGKSRKKDEGSKTDKVTDPDTSANGGDDGKSADDDPPAGVDYSKLLKPDLEKEVAKRNEAREADDQIQVGGTGTVKDLVAALEADDTAGD